MFTRLSSIMLILCFSLAASAEDKVADAPARVIIVTVKGSFLTKGRPQQPIVIKTKEELTTALGDKNAIETVLKEVDFAKEQLILFSWAGSGQDQITADDEKSKDGEVMFRYKPGRTRDLRPHLRLFAIAKDAKWKVATGF